MAGRPWHHVSREPEWIRWLLAGLAALALVVVLACVFVIPQWLVLWELGDPARTLSPADKAKAINDVRTTLLQGIGGAVLLVGVYFTYRQVRIGRDQLQIARQGQVTERFTRAIDQLGHAELDVRLGGIYALEHIANDFPKDWAATIAEVLTAFVRRHAPWPPRPETQPSAGPTIAEVLTAFVRGHVPSPPRPETGPSADTPIEQVPELQVRAPDVQAALTVLFVRQPLPEFRERPNLSATDLRKASLADANLQRARLLDTNLQEAVLDRAQLQKAHLDRTQLQKARLDHAQLQEAHLVDAQLQEAHLVDAQLQEAHLDGAQLKEANLGRAQLQGADLVDAQLQKARFHGANLQGARLLNAQLQEARLVGAKLQKAGLHGANLRGARLLGAQLDKARLDGAQLDKAYADLKTDWPAGFEAREEGVIVLGVDDPADTVHDDLD
jgi:uncharacterized protein YjbI with pentapeptide repeats